MSRPGIEPGPPAREASTLEKSHLDSLSAGYSEPLLGLRRNIRPLQYVINEQFFAFFLKSACRPALGLIKNEEEEE
jgi:hypothetical protein